MKKILMVALAVLIAVAFVTSVFAQEKPAVTPEKASTAEKSGKVKARPFAGEIMSVDVATKTIVVKGKKAEATFDLGDAKFAKAYRMEDVKPGDKVLVRFEEKDGKMIAKYVVKAVGKPKKVEKKEEKADEKAAAATEKPASSAPASPAGSGPAKK
jgi:Cu/Ag efflux protein CusF